MPKMPNQKLKLIYLSRIFEERTDRYHGLTLSDISAALGEYGISAERKSLYDDIEALKLCGYDIKTVRDSHVRYFLDTHKFELAELRLLTDAVQSSKFLTPKKSRELIKKIGELGSKYDASKISKQDYSANRLKTDNEEIYSNIVAIHSAIAENKKIRCNYFEWNAHKQRILRKNGDDYVISPWALCWDDEFYYLVAFDSDAEKIKHFRVDKMLRVKIIDEKREGESSFSDFDMAVYSQRVFHMYGGEAVNVRILADNSLAGVVLDRFGTDVTILNHGDSFEFCTKVMISPTFYSWVLGFGNKMKILSPQNIADEALKIAKEVVESYE
ncbi:MAG: WYL domain-containing protein [Ruminococcaceae bacterium]|nr:WYL domain-containing protein [Oscillospiraceae bacterium]